MKYLPFVQPLLFLGIFAILLTTIDYTLKWGVKHSTDAQTGKINQIMLHKVDPDLMVFGSSVAEVGFNSPLLSQELGLYSFNGAVDGTRFQQYKGLVKEVNAFSENAKYIVFGITYFDFIKTNQLTEPSRFYAFINNDNIYQSLYEIDNENVHKVKSIPFYAFTQYTHTYYKNALLGLRSHLTSRTPVDSLFGFVPHKAAWNADTAKPAHVQKIKLSPELLNDFKILKEQLNSRERKVIVVFMPMHVSGQRHFSNLKEVVQQISTLADPGLFFDYTDSSICESTEYFYNQNHLNTRGANTFSAHFAKELEKRLKL
ncbi:hypothetical protein ACMA1I_00845 [Pontibacter sp. 13R65]